MIDVSELITDPDFAQNYKVKRSKGEWVAGRFAITSTEILNYYGVIQPPEPKILEQIPEIDRMSAILNFYCASPKKLYISQEASEENDGDEQIIYDTIEFKSKQYKIIKVLPFEDYGYQLAFGAEKHE